MEGSVDWTNKQEANTTVNCKYCWEVTSRSQVGSLFPSAFASPQSAQEAGERVLFSPPLPLLLKTSSQSPRMAQETRS